MKKGLFIFLLAMTTALIYTSCKDSLSSVDKRKKALAKKKKRNPEDCPRVDCD